VGIKKSGKRNFIGLEMRYVYTYWSLFGAFILVLGWFISWQITDETFMINESFAMILLCISCPAKIYELKKVQYTLLVFLLMLLFSPLSFSHTIDDGNKSITYHSGRFNGVISPVVFLILVIYVMVNVGALIDLYQLVTKGSKKEQEDARNKNVTFYYEKFGGCSNIELADALKRYSDYPIEAQIALKRIKAEKGIS